MKRIANVPMQLLGRVGLVFLLVALLMPIVPRAGEPIAVVSSGAVVKWFTFPINYRTDLVSGGSPLSKAQFDQLVADGFAAWSTANVATSAVSSTKAGDLALNVTTNAQFTALTCTDNPMVFDEDGSLIDERFGPGASDFILGVAGPCAFFTSTGEIVGGRMLLNGKGVAAPIDLLGTTIHELGHLLGLGHSQVNLNCLPSQGGCANESNDIFGVPTMFPFAFNTVENNASPQDYSITLATDDIAWISFTYPTASFSTTFGAISGTVFFSDGTTHAQGVNVIARNDSNPQRFAVSAVSGDLARADHGNVFLGIPASDRGSADPALRGTFTIPGLAPGNWTVVTESINSAFVDGSSVGPHGRPEGSGGRGAVIPRSGTSSSFGVNVPSAGTTVSGQNITLTGTPATFDSFETSGNRNDTRSNATPLGNGTTTASISPFNSGDIDVYAINVSSGVPVTIEIMAARLGSPSPMDSVLAIRDASGDLATTFGADPVTCGGGGVSACTNDNLDGTTKDSLLQFLPSSTGTFYVIVSDAFGDARPDFAYQILVTGVNQPPPPPGCTKDFDGGPVGSGTDWNTAENWNPDGVPASSDDVCIGSTFSVTYGSGTTTINKLQDIDGTLQVSGGTLSVTTSIAVTGTLNSAGGTLSAPASTITTLTMNGGTVNVNASSSVLALTFNSGTINVLGGTLTLPAAGYTQNGGTLRLNGGSASTAGTITLAGGAAIAGGTPGTLTANINNTGGIIRPGLSPGVLNLTGNVTQGVGGTYEVEIGGTDGPGATNGHDQINVTGTAVLNGTINVTLIIAFVPNIGDSFTIATAVGGGSGSSTFNFPALPPGRAWTDSTSTANALIISVIAASTCSINFDNSNANGLWQEANNWDTNILPGPTDDVCIGAGFTVTKSGAGGDSINSLTVDNAAGLFTLSSDLSIAAISSIGSSGFTHSSGTLSGNGTLSVNGPFTWSAGTQQGSSVTNANGGMTLSSAGTKTLNNGRTLNNAGAATWTDGEFFIGNGAVFTNQASGTFDIQHSSTRNLGGGVGGGSTVNNAGTMTKSAGGGITTVNAGFNNTGTFNANNGTFQLVSAANASTSTGTFNVGVGTLEFNNGTYDLNTPAAVTGAGTTSFTAGTTNFNAGSSLSTPVALSGGTVNLATGGAVTLPTLTQSGGTLGGSATVNITGAFSWTAGTQQGAGGITNANGGMTLSSGGTKTLNNGRTLNSAGAATWTDGEFFIGNGAVFTNQASGTFDIQHGSTRNFGGGVGGGSTVNNAGAMTKSVSAGSTTIVNAAFNGTGTLNSNIGTLSFASTFTQTTGLTRLSGGAISTSTTLGINGGVLDGNGTITGSVSVAGGAFGPGLSAGTLNLTGNYTQTSAGAANFELGGLTAGTQYDQSNITGSATLAGTLNVTLINAFTRSIGDSFTIMTYASVSGAFTTTNLPALGGGNQWAVTYNPTSLVLSVVPPASADLTLSKSDAPDPVAVGQNLTYTLTVSNGGPNPANSVTLVDTLPANVTFVSATPSQGTCSEAAGVVTCPLGTINSPGSATVTIIVTPQAAAIGTITNNASVTATETDPTPGNNSTSQGTTVTPAINLSLIKSDAPDPVRVGDNLTYTLTVANAGPNNASGVSLTDTLPANVAFVSATPSQGTCLEAAGVVTCPLGGINSGANATVTIVVTPQAAAVGTITNNASVTAAETDTNPANNSASASTTVQPVANLGITKTDSPDPALVGGTLTYTVTVSNAGPNGATSVVVTDTLPAGVSFTSATPSQGTCSQASGTVTCNLGSIASGANATVSIVVSPTAAGSPVNNVSVAGAEFDPNTADNSASATTTVNTEANLSITKTDSPDPVRVGQNLTYNVTVTNGGPSPATSVSLTDTLPANVTFVSATPSQGTCSQAAGVVTCPLGTIASGANATVSIVVTPQATAVGTITNNANVTATEPDPNAANNSTSQATTVQPVVDISVTKTDSPDPVRVGNNLTYTVTVANAGPNNATGVTLTDTLPANVTFVSATAPCTQAAGVVTCNLGALASGANSVITIVVTPQAAAAGTATNNASVTSTEFDTNTANNSVSQATTVQPVADVAITKTDAPDPVLAGQNLVYTITVTNNGPNTATNVSATDTLPAGLTFVSASATGGAACNQASGTVTCSVASLASAASFTATITAQTTLAAIPSVSNTATVTATEFDPTAGNNSATATTTVSPAADLAVTKSDSPDPVVISNNLTYTVVVVNNGPSQATSVVLTDTLPAGPAFVSANSTQGTCTQAAGTVSCAIGTMASGANVTVTIVITPAATGSITNTASATSAVADPTAGNNSATATTTVAPAIPPGFNLVATPPMFTVPAGLAATYSVTVTPEGGFTGDVGLTCAGQPELATCTITPGSVTLSGTTAVTAQMVVTTRAGSDLRAMNLPAAPPSPPAIPGWALVLLAFALLPMMLYSWRAGGRRGWPRLAARLATVVLFGVLWTGCASKNGTPQGTHVITVTGASGSITRTTTVTLVVR